MSHKSDLTVRKKYIIDSSGIWCLLVYQCMSTTWGEMGGDREKKEKY